MNIKPIIAGLLLALLGISPAFSQTAVRLCLQTLGANGSNVCQDVSASLPLPTSSAFAGFRPTAFGTPIAVTTGGVTGTLPAGSEVVATNVGTTNGAYCQLGAAATTSSQYIAPNGGWFAFAISGDTQLTCITSTSTTTVNMAGGSGLPTGTGGGGGSTGTQNSNILQWNTVALGSPVAIGTAPSGNGIFGTFDTPPTGNLQTTLTNPPNVTKNGSNAALTGLTPGVGQTGTIVAMNHDLTSVGGTAVSAVRGSQGVVNGANTYNTIAASTTGTMSSTQGGSTGATGDYLSHCVVIPGTTSPGTFTILDNATAIVSFVGGASSVSNLVPFAVPVGAVSTSGAWKITTTTNITAVCFGKFT